MSCSNRSRRGLRPGVLQFNSNYIRSPLIRSRRCSSTSLPFPPNVEGRSVPADVSFGTQPYCIRLKSFPFPFSWEA